MTPAAVREQVTCPECGNPAPTYIGPDGDVRLEAHRSKRPTPNGRGYYKCGAGRHKDCPNWWGVRADGRMGVSKARPSTVEA